MDDDLALYVPDGDGFVATLRTQGGWHPNQQHGGPVQALMARAVENTETLVPMQVARLTHDLFRPVPIGVRLDVTAQIIREGKRIQLVDVVLRVGDVEHVRTRAVRLRTEDVSDLPGLPETPADTVDVTWAEDIMPSTFPEGIRRPGFLDGIELRHIGARGFDHAAWGRWARLRGPLVAGESPSPLQRLSVTADFTNLIGVLFDPRTTSAINPDLTVHVLRMPVGDWVAVVGDTRFAADTARGISIATVRDRDGVCGYSSNCQLVQRL